MPPSTQPQLEKLISGGQTGADRAALDWAIFHYIPHGGWCPKGRIAEDGRIDARYQLMETPGSAYEERTAWNVRDSQGTVIFFMGDKPVGGSELTRLMTIKYRKPCLLLSHAKGCMHGPALKKWTQENHVSTLNVAGSRSSEESGIGNFVAQTLENAYFPDLRK